MPDDMSMMLYESHMQGKKDAKKTGHASALEAFISLVDKYDNEEERKSISESLEGM